jgi:ribosome maturation factor RimP
MAKQKGIPTVQACEGLAAPVLEKLGLRLWDVRFEKEGAGWYLRYFIDRDGGVNIKDCEDFSKEMSKLLDEADPIEQSYVLEVSSPGIERQLSKDWHFAACMGELVTVRLIRPVDGIREFTGELSTYEGDEVTILLAPDVDGEEPVAMTFTKKESAYIRLYADFDSE